MISICCILTLIFNCNLTFSIIVIVNSTISRLATQYAKRHCARGKTILEWCICCRAMASVVLIAGQHFHVKNIFKFYSLSYIYLKESTKPKTSIWSRLLELSKRIGALQCAAGSFFILCSLFSFFYSLNIFCIYTLWSLFSTSVLCYLNRVLSMLDSFVLVRAWKCYSFESQSRCTMIYWSILFFFHY